MVKSRAEVCGLDPNRVYCHTFRGAGITAPLKNNGKLNVAQHIAGRADASTTKLHNRRWELMDKGGVEKIEIYIHRSAYRTHASMSSTDFEAFALYDFRWNPLLYRTTVSLCVRIWPPTWSRRKYSPLDRSLTSI